jgi:hypothetical protein
LFIFAWKESWPKGQVCINSWVKADSLAEWLEFRKHTTAMLFLKKGGGDLGKDM